MVIRGAWGKNWECQHISPYFLTKVLFHLEKTIIVIEGSSSSSVTLVVKLLRFLTVEQRIEETDSPYRAQEMTGNLGGQKG